MKENWKDVVGYEGEYMVSDLGNVKSLKFDKERAMNPGLNRRGYLKVTLSKDGKQKICPVHVEVAKAFLNHTSCGYERVVDHINEIRVDNRLVNLQVITNRENRERSIDKSKTSSRYRGVSWDKATNKWMSSIKLNGKRYHLGRFTDELEASEAVERFRKQNKLN